MTVAVFLGSLLGSMAFGLPIAFALIVCAVAIMLYQGSFDAQVVAQNMIVGADSFPLLAIPFFMLAGELMTVGGMSRRIVDMSLAWVGHIRGGLGIVTVMAAIIMASLSGSAAADTAALASILIPMMRNAGYNVPRSCGLIAAGGIIAPVIPPSIGYILFGVAANVSISRLFLAGIVPGILMAASLLVAWMIVVRRDRVQVLPRQGMRARGRALVDAFWALLMPVIILAGIRFGVFTPTEAAVVAAVYALLVGLFIYRELTPALIYHAFLSAAKTTAVVMFLAAAAFVSAWLIASANIPQEVAEMLAPFMDNKTLLMFVLMAIVLVVGTALDFTPTVLILTPVLMPVVRQAGIDPVYFGVLFIMNNAIGLITPPVGIVLNIVAGIAKEPLGRVITGVMPFLIAQSLVLLLLILFPQIVLVPLNFLR
ncbi:MAG TPA: TRAP transporter large permease subunit [Azospirillaceae bacterium]|nr:TRAP transporter large permease subunit [Azospirillaceae bacterium]